LAWQGEKGTCLVRACRLTRTEGGKKYVQGWEGKKKNTGMSEPDSKRQRTAKWEKKASLCRGETGLLGLMPDALLGVGN